MPLCCPVQWSLGIRLQSVEEEAGSAPCSPQHAEQAAAEQPPPPLQGGEEEGQQGGGAPPAQAPSGHSGSGDDGCGGGSGGSDGWQAAEATSSGEITATIKVREGAVDAAQVHAGSAAGGQGWRACRRCLRPGRAPAFLLPPSCPGAC
jgi:hypothetical protein